MKKNINTIALEEIFKQNADGFLPLLIEIYNPDIYWGDNSSEQEDTYLRIINDTVKIRYDGKLYLPCCFEFEPPEENGKSLGTASLSVTSLDSRIPQLLGMCEIPCEITIKAVFAKVDENSKYIFYPIEKWKFKANVATCDATKATLTLSNDTFMTTNLPRDLAMQNQFPSVASD
jgi:hypothetical protein